MQGSNLFFLILLFQSKIIGGTETAILSIRCFSYGPQIITRLTNKNRQRLAMLETSSIRVSVLSIAPVTTTMDWTKLADYFCCGEFSFKNILNLFCLLEERTAFSEC
ncbi:hypothetical protein HI914_01275 [Erysiphe necator]|nr:hypothetical protein HI914_01275 [Erysiphe necator]